MELKDLFHVIKKRIWVIITINILVTGAAAFYSFNFIKPQYEAKSNLVVNKTNEASGGLVSYDSLMANKGFIATYKRIIQNPAILSKVLEQYPDIGLSQAELSERLEVSSEDNTQIITLGFKDFSYEKAAYIVNAVSKVFVTEVPSIMKVDNVVILNEAVALDNMGPVTTKPLIGTIVVWFASLVLVIGAVNVLEYFDTTIKSGNDVRKILGVTDAVIIPKFSKKDLKQDRTINSKQSRSNKQTMAAGS
ncbi:YveK family protein [Paenibacillus sedimenti]|uniref:Lipopolysaccharide biosynthesis protein n=1 Tax=Paenibacillus sedimenti TaxID=2770274 RepID=A0A926QHP3_9BACL|nr:Wzz/FepE/Etk N-terminal domain-containing protein [Paenibacillus sedimenti]MBD0379766.1 lipopolysaccharide biosynthesis protein [Paenibacillus sedimenti]